jgi:hypothetical protein
MSTRPRDPSRLASLRRNYAPQFHGGLEKVELEGREAFIVWNMVTTVLDMLADVRRDIEKGDLNPRSLSLANYSAEDLLGFVAEQLDPRKKS